MSEYIRRQLEDSHIVELRHHIGGRWKTSYHEKLEPLLDAIRDRAGDGNLYTSLNRPDRCHGRRALRDDNIEVITRLPFDLDPSRPHDVPATDAELAAALEGRELLVRMLAGYGWPRPALGMSGNGTHALYRVRIKSSPVWRRRVPFLYMGLANLLHAQLSELNVSFDRTVRNPAQIWRLYGTVNRKGTATAERPHRRAEITLPAGPWQIVPVDVLRRTLTDLEPAVVVPKRPAARGPRGCGANQWYQLCGLADQLCGTRTVLHEGRLGHWPIRCARTERLVQVEAISDAAHTHQFIGRVNGTRRQQAGLERASRTAGDSFEST